jgi:anaerobic selenocysteine-containing dehydrogenase
MLGKQAIPAMGEAWPDWWFVCELARRMGYGEYFPWQSVEELIEYYLEPSGMTVRQLDEESPSGVLSGTVEDEDYWRQHPEQPRFPTPSGKVELYCETLKSIGADPLPKYIEPAESPVSTPDVAKEYPLILTTGARVNEYWHSCFHAIPKLRERTPEPTAEISPESATAYGVRDGEMAILESKRGHIEIKIRVTNDIMPGVVSIPHGWVQGNANLLTDDSLHDRASGYPNLHALLCRIGSRD